MDRSNISQVNFHIDGVLIIDFLSLRSATNNIIVDMQNQMRTNEIRIDLLRQQNESLKCSLEKLLTMNHNNNHNSSMVSEERYEELRSQSRQEPPQRRYSYANETVPSVGFSHCS